MCHPVALKYYFKLIQINNIVWLLLDCTKLFDWYVETMGHMEPIERVQYVFIQAVSLASWATEQLS